MVSCSFSQGGEKDSSKMCIRDRFNRQSLGGVELTKQQIEDLNLGKAIFVEGMARKDGEIFSS